MLIGALPPHRVAWVAFSIATSACDAEVQSALREDVDLALGRVAIRGTKRDSRWRRNPILFEWQRDLLTIAVSHADGLNGVMFSSWANVRRDIAAACKRIAIPRCSPNDLRRTFAQWVRRDGIPLELAAPMMGHKDTRMLERVYGRLSPDALEDRLRTLASKLDCDVYVPDSVTLTEFDGLPGLDTDSQAVEFAEKVVPRAGIEPATRGFSVLCSTN